MRQNILIRGPGGIRRAGALVLGPDIQVEDTAGGLPELVGVRGGPEPVLEPSGGDDAQAIRSALARRGRALLGPGGFSVCARITLDAGQSVVGAGPDRTTVSAAGVDSVFHLTGSGAAVAGLRVSGGGSGSCVSAQTATDVRLRDLRLQGAQKGISLVDVSRGEVSRVFAEDVGIGVAVATGAQLDISDLSVQWSGTGLALSQVDGVRCAGLAVLGCAVAVNAGPGSALVFDAVQVAECTYGLSVTSSRDVTLAGLHSRDVQETAVTITGCSSVAIRGCVVLYSETSLNIGGSTAVTVDGFVSDVRLVPATAPHLVVGSGSTLVRVVGFQRLNPYSYPPPQYEVDVSGAGGRVLFIQHDFDPARINSGGNFVAL